MRNGVDGTRMIRALVGLGSFFIANIVSDQPPPG
jgi:hypothetical protein